jgi:hypothetical protein
VTLLRENVDNENPTKNSKHVYAMKLSTKLFEHQCPQNSREVSQVKMTKHLAQTASKQDGAGKACVQSLANQSKVKQKQVLEGYLPEVTCPK